MYQQLAMKDFDAFYEILTHYFPAKEVKEYAYLKTLFETNAAQAIVQKEGEQIVGGLCYMEVEDFVFIDYLVIIESHQGNKQGEKILQYFKNKINKPIVLEVEHPEDEISKRRISFYQRQGFILNNYQYVIPPVRSLKYAISFLLMTYPTSLSEDAYTNMYPRILKTVYGIDEV